MRAQFSIAIIGFMVAFPAIGLAQPSEFQQKTACMGDAMRLCFWSIPNREKITHCLYEKHEQLSPGCRVVFDASSGPGKPETISH